MPKKTTVLILLLALVTAVLVFFAISAETGLQGPESEESAEDQDKPVEKTTTVFFNPQSIDVTTSLEPIQSVDIMVDTGNSSISGVQVELQYDSTAITNVRLEPEATAEGFFGGTAVVLFNDTGLDTGRVSYAITIGPNQESKQGAGKIATLYFEPALNAPSATTTVEFLNKTLVTMLGENESILKDTVPLNITLTGPATQNQTISPTTAPLPPQEQQIP